VLPLTCRFLLWASWVAQDDTRRRTSGVFFFFKNYFKYDITFKITIEFKIIITKLQSIDDCKSVRRTLEGLLSLYSLLSSHNHDVSNAHMLNP
jgi:hypothetical protein